MPCSVTFYMSEEFIVGVDTGQNHDQLNKFKATALTGERQLSYCDSSDHSKILGHINIFIYSPVFLVI